MPLEYQLGRPLLDSNANARSLSLSFESMDVGGRDAIMQKIMGMAIKKAAGVRRETKAEQRSWGRTGSGYQVQEDGEDRAHRLLYLLVFGGPGTRRKSARKGRCSRRTS
jgi:hypothetical protein